MVSVYTPNIQLEEPARGDQVGTWDTPVNANMTLIDLVVGGQVTIPLAGAPVVLAAAQFQAKTIVFNSTLTANVVITFPSSFSKSYEIFNLCTGTSNFTITLKTTVAGTLVVCCPPNEVVDVANIYNSMYFKNLGRVGSYWDHGGSSVPAWVSGCSTPPYLNCDGSAFSSAVYPNLTNFLGGAVLPDSRGRARAALNQTTFRLSAVVSGVDGDTILAGGGDQRMQTHTHANTLNDPSHAHAVTGGVNGGTGGSGYAGGAISAPFNTTAITISPSVTGVTITNVSNGAGGAQNVQPTYIGGLTMIRAG